jgi:hypothetical protein
MIGAVTMERLCAQLQRALRNSITAEAHTITKEIAAHEATAATAIHKLLDPHRHKTK